MMNARSFFIYSSVPLLFFLDRYTKMWAFHNVAHQDIHIFPGLTLSLVLNRGISWSFFSFSSPFLFWTLTAFISATLLWFASIAFKSTSRNESLLGKLLVIAGAASNIIDRFLYGGVVDFIDCSLGSWHWPSFNVADMAILCGLALIIGRIYYDGIFSKHA